MLYQFDGCISNLKFIFLTLVIWCKDYFSLILSLNLKFETVHIFLKNYFWHLTHFFAIFFADKKIPGKSKDEQMAEKKQELEKRLLDVNDKIGNAKKPPKKGK